MATLSNIKAKKLIVAAVVMALATLAALSPVLGGSKEAKALPNPIASPDAFASALRAKVTGFQANPPSRSLNRSFGFAGRSQYNESVPPRIRSQLRRDVFGNPDVPPLVKRIIRNVFF